MRSPNQKEADLISREELHEGVGVNEFAVDEYLTEIEREAAEDRAWELYIKEVNYEKVA